MKLDFQPSFLSGTVSVPPSKSITHRMLIAAALAEGKSLINNIAFSDDVSATLDCLTSLGVKTETHENSVTVYGVNGVFSPKGKLNCRESGSTLRFLLPLCLLSGKETELCGTEHLFERPFEEYESFCKENGFLYQKDSTSVRVSGNLKIGDYHISCARSSQFASGLLFALSKTGGILNLEGKTESRSYLELTRTVLNDFGAGISWEDEKTLVVTPSPMIGQNLTVEGDESASAFFIALNFFGANLKITGRNPNTKQGDSISENCFRAISEGMPTISVADCPDLFPILAVTAALKQGATFTDTGRLRFKESDRGEAIASELGKCGAKIEIKENSITVHPSELHPSVMPLDGHNDHRIVMALSVLLTQIGGSIEGAEAVSKSFPDFFEKMTALGADIKISSERN